MPLRAAMMQVIAAAFFLPLGNDWSSASQELMTEGLKRLEKEFRRDELGGPTTVLVEENGMKVLGLLRSCPCSTQAILKGWDIQSEMTGI